MESETVLCSADFHCDDPFLRRVGNIFRHYLFISCQGSLFTYIEKYCKIKKDFNCIYEYVYACLQYRGDYMSELLRVENSSRGSRRQDAPSRHKPYGEYG